MVFQLAAQGFVFSELVLQGVVEGVTRVDAILVELGLEFVDG